MAGSVTACQVLVVDDDASICAVLIEFLEDEGFAVEVARNGRDALDQLRGGLRPCLILLDWKMPVMGGAQFREAQQQDDALATIPVVVLSAHIIHDATEQVDADAFLPKPFTLGQLSDTLARFCQGK